MVVIKALGEEGYLGNDKVSPERYYDGYQSGPYCSAEVQDVAHEPYEDEGDRNASGGLLCVVLVELRDEDEDGRGQ